MGFGRVELLVLVLTVARRNRRRLVREDRPLAPAPAPPDHIAVLVAYVLLARRLGWGELLVIAVLVVPLVFLPVRLLGGSRPR